ncbi:hypothetical protein GCM10009645_49580 [Mycolicibacterium poriferae]|uniref:Uncharacterized protein n=1 Tax=Mycolicibacterium poriferae TaxID=39694 RepID=A0A6N4VA11_9MYCO|nr:hypothetical protein MPOR_19490 [Mycolicibacterium poriferae]
MAAAANLKESFVANKHTLESGAPNAAVDAVAEVEDLLVIRLSDFAEKLQQKRPLRLTGRLESEKLSATSRDRTFLGGHK